MIADNKQKIIIIAVTAAFVVAAGIGFWYWSQKRAGAPETPAAVKVKDGLGAEAFNKTNNPLFNELPETNPFYTNTNPFK